MRFSTETELVEFYPISPTLTRIRVHKNIKPQKEIICYPVSIHQNNQNIFSAYKRTAPSTVSFSIPTPPPIPPPSPPRRKSSRNNPTLRLVSTMKVKSEKSPICKRHETCFTTTSNIDKSKVNYLRDKISCKLSPVPGRRSTSPKIRVVKKITASPELKDRITSSVTTYKDPKTAVRKVQSKTNIHGGMGRSKSSDSVRNLAKLASGSRNDPLIISNESLSSRDSSKSRTFGIEKKKFEYQLPTRKIDKSPDLLSPNEVKKAVQTSQRRSSPSSVTYKKSNAVLASTKYNKTKDSLPIKVGFSDKAKAILKNTPSLLKLPKRGSPCPSSTSEKSKIALSSLESLCSPKCSRKTDKSSAISSKMKSFYKEDRSNQKYRKQQINDEIANKDRNNNRTKRDQTIQKGKKRIDDIDRSRKLQNLSFEEFGSNITLEEIKRQKRAIESNHFFQHLLLRNINPTPSPSINNSWLIEKTNQLSRRRTPSSDPNVGAMKVYLKHTRPVSDSKFISLDMANRSRSASPKSVTFDSSSKCGNATVAKRSSSLPAKLIFSETSRPVSPVIVHRKLISPPPSPRPFRSPCSQKSFNPKEKRPQEYNLYMCPSLNHSTTSLDSLKSEDFHKYIKEFVFPPMKAEKFKDLNQFYTGIEKLGMLERTFSLKPRKKSENEIIDFDRWREVRTRERAEQELDFLYNQIKEREKEKGFLYLPKDVNKYRWKQEFDRGLRIKEKSVDDIKEEFERLKIEESDRESAKRRELAYLKDTYKPLWRGASVATMALSMVERRSQSEGRIKPNRLRNIDPETEQFLDTGIGSRIWSSLSMEQVNLLKEQLTEIYNIGPKKPTPNFSMTVPESNKASFVPTLTVRRNSDYSEQFHRPSIPITNNDLSEDDKKIISQTLSKELLEKLASQRKKSNIMVGKEIMGAVAAVDANVKVPTKTSGQLPQKPLIKTDALNHTVKLVSASETESGSTDESTKTVIHIEKTEDVKKKVEYFEKANEMNVYTPTVHKPADETDDVEEDTTQYNEEDVEKNSKLFQSKSCQNIREFFGEKELIKFATVPLSATRRRKFTPKTPELRATEISPLRSEVSVNTSVDSLCRSRSLSPQKKIALIKTGEVSRLKNKFEWLEDEYGNRTLRRSRSDSDLSKIWPHVTTGYVDNLRKLYEYPAHSGRGRSRQRRGGVVSPIFLRAEDRLMPHINIISKIANLYTKKGEKHTKESRRSIEELAEILGCPVGEVERMKEKFNSQDDISLVGHMYTSSPSISELRDIAPYLAANWTAHRYPRYQDNTRSVSSPEQSVASRDISIVKRDQKVRKSVSPPHLKLKSSSSASSILKPMQKLKQRSADFSQNRKYDPKMHEPIARYQPTDEARYKNGWNVWSKPTVSFKGVVFRFKKK